MQVARDGEGARKLITVNVEGAVSARSAKKIAMSIANSPLVKTAVAGEDANWGPHRHGGWQGGEPADRDRISISFGDIRVAHEGARDPAYSEAATSAYMKGEAIDITVSLGMGRGKARPIPATSPRPMSRSTGITVREVVAAGRGCRAGRC